MNARAARLHWYWNRFTTSIKYHGIPYTLLWCVMYSLRLAPTKWFLTYRAKHFDRRHNLDTAGIIEMASLGVTSNNVNLCNYYEPCTPECFSEILSKLSIKFQDYVFVDLGSGKGAAMLVASMFPFKRIVGVEWSPRLAGISRENIRKFRSRWQQCRDIVVVEEDASEFELPNCPLVVYLYNTFKEDLMRQVLRNLKDDHRAHPRNIVVVYYNPVCKAVFAEADFLRLIEIQEDYPAVAVYETEGIASEWIDAQLDRVGSTQHFLAAAE
jgi:hypothetical protein